MLTHGYKIGFDHFSLSFLEMGLNFTTTLIDKCLKGLEEPMVDRYVNLFYKTEILKNPFHEDLLQIEPSEKCFIYK